VTAYAGTCFTGTTTLIINRALRALCSTHTLVLCVNFVHKELFVSKSEAVAKYIPFLRRYARALTGTQSSGDAYVVAALEALIEDPSVT
jgi:hypothetical protein